MMRKWNWWVKSKLKRSGFTWSALVLIKVIFSLQTKAAEMFRWCFWGADDEANDNDVDQNEVEKRMKLTL